MRDRSRCSIRPDGSTLVAQLFEQVRTALLATSGAVDGAQTVAQFTNFTRVENRQGRLIGAVERTTTSTSAARPFVSVSPDSLSAFGYIVEHPDEVIMYAPDATVLLADSFLAQHCLFLLEGKDEREGSIGIGFRPVNTPKNLVDVKGTLWIDRKTQALQVLDYYYDPLPMEFQRAGVGGIVEYHSIAGGIWFVNRWSIRMPLYDLARASMLPRKPGDVVRKEAAYVGGLQIIGGAVEFIRSNNQVLYTGSSSSTVGENRAEIMSTRITAGADLSQVAGPDRIRVPLPTGNYEVTRKCDFEADSNNVGVLMGKLTNAASNPLTGATVRAAWQQDFRISGANDISWQRRENSTMSRQNGLYLLCNLPLEHPLKVVATYQRTRSKETLIKLYKASPTAEVNLELNVADEPSADAAPVSTAPLANASAVDKAPVDSRTATLLVTDLSGKPVPFAAVSLNGGETRVTDSAGRLVMRTNEQDTLRVQVRRMGYGAFVGRVTRASKSEPFRLTLLPNSQSLATIDVTAKREKSPLERTGFYDRMLDSQRGASIGEFMTPEQLELRGTQRTSLMLGSSRYVRLGQYRGRTILTGRSVASLKGGGTCQMNIFLDGIRINMMSDPKGMVDSIDDLVGGGAVSAIEIYPSAALAPARFQVLPGSGDPYCGVVAFWTGGH